MKPGTWKLDDGPLDDRPTFLAHALAMSLRHGPGPWPDEAQELHDEPPRPPGGAPYLPSVSRDGVETHHFSPRPDPEAVAEVAETICALATAGVPDPGDLRRLHARLETVSALAIVDEVLEHLARVRPPRERVHRIGRHLAEYGTAREAVKVGLALVGATGGEPDRELLLLLGTLEEFTLYAVVALVRTQPDRQRAAYELARRVTCWGRVHAVERLKGCDDPEIKAWLLRDGFRNGVMNEYLAHLAATTGGLYEALLEPEVDNALLDGAAAILAALAEGGPAEDMSDYADGRPAMSRLADLLRVRPATLDRLANLLTIRHHLKDDPLRGRYDALAAEPRWRERVMASLADPGHPDFHHALWLADRLDLPTATELAARLEREPTDDYAWSKAVEQDPARFAGMAERLLPLAELARGPELHHGFGQDCDPDRSLESVVGGLGSVPGLGVTLIETALRNRVIRVRRQAVATLAAWPAVPGRLMDRVRQAAGVEPDEDTRREMLTLSER
ncbi:hypothetical protein [Nonomuraea sediminis]|uniref:hypothetical protein n=1 Tax=Nonomuraea sediminis TaxID=2835864 RepID=UPI001BDD95F9|nr:hypothetical protein [Nonomuraea sediminis]